MRALAFSFALLLVPFLIGCAELSGEGDIQSSKYSSFEEASRKRAFRSGWLPQALPTSATNIVEVHNVDSNELWATFQYSDNDIDGLVRGCAIDHRARLPNPKRTRRSAAWWPVGLTDGSDERSRDRWMILSCPGMRHAESVFPAGIAVDLRIRTAWYWMAK